MGVVTQTQTVCDCVCVWLKVLLEWVAWGQVLSPHSRLVFFHLCQFNRRLVFVLVLITI